MNHIPHWRRWERRLGPGYISRCKACGIRQLGPSGKQEGMEASRSSHFFLALAEPPRTDSGPVSLPMYAADHSPASEHEASASSFAGPFAVDRKACAPFQPPFRCQSPRWPGYV